MSSNRSGAILITSLWILAILSILAMGIGFRVSIEARLSKYNLDRVKGLYLAKAGAVKAMELLSKDTNAYDTIRECGITLPPDKKPEDVFIERLGEGSFTISYNEEGRNCYGLTDEERKININKAEYKVIYQLLLGKEPENLAASIINWRSPAQLMVEGAQDRDYESLAAPYKCKHADFSCIEELMLVKDMTPEIFESIKDYVTVYTDGKININTATERVLRSYGLSDQSIGTIMLTRNGADNTIGTKDDGGFNNIGTIADQIGVPAYSPERTVLSENNFTTASKYFRIESKGMIDKSRIGASLVCVVDGKAKKLKYYREY
ncbi:MAG: type II secretion system protein GspK [Candidatus Omnitrophota bacterium]|nr:type II secretion system protein GspK [Candidatus Omnitrophota bacterium]